MYNDGSRAVLIILCITEVIVYQNTEISMFIHNLFHQDISAIVMEIVKTAIKS